MFAFGFIVASLILVPAFGYMVWTLQQEKRELLDRLFVSNRQPPLNTNMAERFTRQEVIEETAREQRKKAQSDPIAAVLSRVADAEARELGVAASTFLPQ